jgi:selenocysteine lyase/cysteine desulfurase
LKIFVQQNKTSVISFNIEGIHPYDIGTIYWQIRNSG